MSNYCELSKRTKPSISKNIKKMESKELRRFDYLADFRNPYVPVVVEYFLTD